ncbi:Six-hairpin glycosidase [Penicillium sp. IBT 16267x]|nr:Six-hairpin glycosidase [Penicillium sp. IBT 16267x]
MFETLATTDYPQESFVATTFAPKSFWARRREVFDAEIDAAVKELVTMIRGAQKPDGYLNIHYSVVEPGKRFTNLRDMHELYNAGHLIEAALAHHLLYKNDELLSPILKYVDLLAATFGAQEDQIPGYPGHPEIELALLRLYKVSGNSKHLQLAQFFIEERGNPRGGKEECHYYDAEAKARGESEHDLPMYYPAARSYWYQQAHVPVVNQVTIEGHSVRAMYLLTAVADLVRICQPSSETGAKFLPAVHRLWSNMVEKKTYVTGGIGAMKKWEGFGIDYFLPQGTDEGGCYAETCAAIGVMMLAERLFQIELDSHYADIMELCLYNAVLTGMSLDGKAFTYVNQLASSDQDTSQRHEWFDVAFLEEPRSQPDSYVAIVAVDGFAGELDTSDWSRQIAVEPHTETLKERSNLCFIPYYLRANRGGKGQMRVGLRAV